MLRPIIMGICIKLKSSKMCHQTNIIYNYIIDILNRFLDVAKLNVNEIHIHKIHNFITKLQIMHADLSYLNVFLFYFITKSLFVYLEKISTNYIKTLHWSSIIFFYAIKKQHMYII